MTDTKISRDALEHTAALGRQIRIEARKLIQSAEMEMRGGLVVVRKSDLDALASALDAEKNAWGIMEQSTENKS